MKRRIYAGWMGRVIMSGDGCGGSDWNAKTQNYKSKGKKKNPKTFISLMSSSSSLLLLYYCCLPAMPEPPCPATHPLLLLLPFLLPFENIQSEIITTTREYYIWMFSFSFLFAAACCLVVAAVVVVVVVYFWILNHRILYTTSCSWHKNVFAANTYTPA